MNSVGGGEAGTGAPGRWSSGGFEIKAEEDDDGDLNFEKRGSDVISCVFIRSRGFSQRQ